jgi:hypothetical protein
MFNIGCCLGQPEYDPGKLKSEERLSRREQITHVALGVLAAITAVAFTALAVCISAAAYVFIPLGVVFAPLSSFLVVLVIATIALFSICTSSYETCIFSALAKRIENAFQKETEWATRAKTILLVALAVFTVGSLCWGAVATILFILPPVIFTALPSFPVLVVAWIVTAVSFYFFANGRKIGHEIVDIMRSVEKNNAQL